MTELQKTIINKVNRLSDNDIQILSSITSAASIAIKNARLYEQAYIEARTYELT